MSQPNIQRVFAYHQKTKHRFDGYAKGPESLDWDDQPEAFRWYEGASHLDLPLQSEDQGLSFAALSQGVLANNQPLDAARLAQLLQFSLGIAAWKQYGQARWALRCNPSSGNLHPTECYPLILGQADFDDGLYHYRPDRHQLEKRCQFSANNLTDVSGTWLGLTSIIWREAWKYGERAYRYCQLDLGHALAALSYSAALIGYRVTPLLQYSNDQLDDLLGLNRSDEFFANEREYADLLLCLHPHNAAPTAPPDSLFSQHNHWFGRANQLDRRHFYRWEILDEVAQACHRSANQVPNLPDSEPCPSLPASTHDIAQSPALGVIRQRRSAQSFHPDHSSISQADFFRLLDRTLLRLTLAPWSAQNWPSRVHLLLFVHRVEGLPNGLYLLARSTTDLAWLKQQIRTPQFHWNNVSEAPKQLRLYHLVQANARKAAANLSCVQAIAGDSAFSLGMLAEFDSAVNQAAWQYNELFWEAGMIGQSLYLEAEAIGLRGTGIGCFFDDGVHEMLGLASSNLQSVYHFTVGTPIVDHRLTTLPAYPQKMD